MIPETALTLTLAQALRWLLARLQVKRPAQGILGAMGGIKGTFYAMQAQGGS